MNRLSLISADFEGKTKVNNWLSVFENMSAYDQLDEDQTRQMIFDLETSYNAFNKLLHTS
jgi:ESCRT-I complex subunit VPS28